MFERILKYFQQRPITERRGCKMQNFISFLMVLIFFENFEKKFIVRRASRTGELIPEKKKWKSTIKSFGISLFSCVKTGFKGVPMSGLRFFQLIFHPTNSATLIPNLFSKSFYRHPFAR